MTKMTPYVLGELMLAVHDKSSGKRKQKVHFEYGLVGFIPVDADKSRTGMTEIMPVPEKRILLSYDAPHLRGHHF